LAASELNPEIFLVTRAESGEGEKRLRQAGANRIISPYRVGGLKIADGLLRPHVTDFLDLAVYSKEGDLIIEEFCVPDKSPLAGKTLKSAFLRDKTNMIVAAIISPSGETKFNPSGDSIIEAGSTLIGLGLKTEFENLENMLLGE
jgi:voltage-gated potassium channel